MKELDELLKEKTLAIGMNGVLRRLRAGKAKRIILASNCSERLKNDVIYYAKITKTEVIQSELSNEEIRTACKKPFSVSVLCS